MNHQKEAERLYDEVYRPRDPDAMELLAAIQAKATLAVADQLRVANLIAIWNAKDESNAAAIFDEDQELNWPWGILAAKIAEALGIEQS